MPITLTKNAFDVFNPLDGSSPRGAIMGEARLWGTEVEGVLNTLFDNSGGSNIIIGAGATAVLKIGDPAYAPETTTISPDGTNVRMAVSNSVFQMHKDNIVKGGTPWGTVGIGGNITWKAPHPVALQPDVPFLNIGFRTNGNGEVLIEGGGVGAIVSPSIAATQFPIGFYTQDSSGNSQLRLRLASGDNYALGIGTGGPSSELQGSFFHIHNPLGTGIATTHYTNADSGSAGTDGSVVGLWNDESLRLWNYENQPVNFGVNNAQYARLTAVGFAVGLSQSPSERLHVASSNAGSILTRTRIDAVNTTSGKTSSLSLGSQDNNAGTIRGLFNIPGPLNGGSSDQGVLDMLVEDGTLRVVTFDSLAANSAARMLLHDRAGTSRIALTAATAAPLINLAAAGGEYRVNGVKVLGAQGAAVADATGGATIDTQARTAINALLARLRAHGAIAT